MSNSKQLNAQYGDVVNNSNSYSNNYLADDDQSVEAQHVIYSFQEDGDKSTPRKGGGGRKRWLCLMLTVFSLLSIILALGIVYGKQLQDRTSVGTVSEANKAEKNNDVNDTQGTNNGVDEQGEAAESTTSTAAEDTSPVDATTLEVKQEDIYLTPESGAEVEVEATTVAPVTNSSTITAEDEIVLDEEATTAVEEATNTGVLTVQPTTVAPTEGTGTWAPTEGTGTWAPTEGTTRGRWVPLWKRRQTSAPTSIGSLRGSTVIDLGTAVPVETGGTIGPVAVGTGFPVAPEVASDAPVVPVATVVPGVP